MATYVIGDIQGCYDEFLALLNKIAFNSKDDTLWITGDLVNRGKDSLAVLQLVMSLGDRVVSVLGNHDLHLLAVAKALRVPSPEDALQPVLNSPDLVDIINWLRNRPLLHHDPVLGYTMIHAGLAPAWDLQKASQCAHEVEKRLRGDDYIEVLQNMYGNTPTHWDDNLTGMDRVRYIINCFTRLRFCNAEGHLDLESKGDIQSAKPGFMPWFMVPGRKSSQLKLIFGHWASLVNHWDQVSKIPNIFPLDSGCVWGNRLSALCLETQQRYSIPCEHYKKA